MGCSFDRFYATFKKKEDTKVFTEIYNEKLKDDLYWGEDDFLSEDDFLLDAIGNYDLGIEAEPLFKMMENGAQFVDVIFAYLESVPNEPFYAEYECTFNNCGAIVFTTYEYANGELKITDKNSEDSYLDYCPECEWCAYDDDDFEDEAICTIDEWDENEIYRCPKCGAILEWDIFVDKAIWKMIDGKLELLDEE